MAARMPGLSLQIGIDGAGEGPIGLRLVHGKLEARGRDGSWDLDPDVR